MKRFRTFFKEYFNFSKRERNGIIVLVLILILVISGKVIISKVNENQKVDFTEFESEIDEFISYQTPDFSKSPSLFDPNSAEAEDLLSLGLSPKTVNSILEYREKDWKFYKPEDLLRVYGITEEEYNHVKDYINIPKKQYASNYKYQYPESPKSQKEPEYFYFDPNTATKEDLEKLGFLSWQSDNIIKYRNKGGYFNSSDDLDKIYGLEQEFTDKLKPWVKIDSTNLENITPKTIDNSEINIEINSASAKDLQRLSGIGPSYSKRIIAYRDKLGGYISVEQLMEVYGFTDELFESVKNSFTIDLTEINKININKAEFAEIISHPYIDKEITMNILNYRKFKGEIKTTEELLKQKAINEETYNKISPYITAE